MPRNSYFIVSKELAADKTISATAKLLFGQLLEHRNRKTGQCNPEINTLAGEIGAHRTSVMRALAELQRSGRIEIHRTQRGNYYKFAESQNATSQVAFRISAESQNATLIPFTEPNPIEPIAAASPEVVTDRAAAAGEQKAKPTTQKPPARETDGTGFRAVKATLHELAPLVRLPLPDDDLVWRVIDAGNGASGEEIQEALVFMWKRDALRNMRSWGFIPLKIADLARRAASA